MVKRIFAALLTLAMLLSVCSVEVFAADDVQVFTWSPSETLAGGGYMNNFDGLDSSEFLTQIKKPGANIVVEWSAKPEYGWFGLQVDGGDGTYPTYALVNYASNDSEYYKYVGQFSISDDNKYIISADMTKALVTAIEDYTFNGIVMCAGGTTNLLSISVYAPTSIFEPTAHEAPAGYEEIWNWVPTSELTLSGYTHSDSYDGGWGISNSVFSAMKTYLEEEGARLEFVVEPGGALNWVGLQNSQYKLEVVSTADGGGSGNGTLAATVEFVAARNALVVEGENLDALLAAIDANGFTGKLNLGGSGTFSGVYIYKKSADACAHDGEFTYVPNEDGTHQKVCSKCEEVVDEAEDCTFDDDGTVTYEKSEDGHTKVTTKTCTVCEGETVEKGVETAHDYKEVVTYKVTESGHIKTTTKTCSVCEYETVETGEETAHEYDETTGECVCGKEKPECTHATTEAVEVATNDKTHNVVCTDECGEIIGTEAHTYKDGVCTECGHKCTHASATEETVKSYKDNEDGTHTLTTTVTSTCADCETVTEKTTETVEKHTFKDGKCVCEADEPEITVEVEQKEGAPAASVNTAAVEALKKEFGADASEDVEVSLVVEDATATVPAADKALVELDTTYTVGQYLNIELLVNEAPKTEVSTKVTITIAIPESLLAENRTFSIVHVHDGLVSVLQDEDSDPLTITFSTSNFSTFAIVHRDAPAKEKETTVGRTPDMPNTRFGAYIVDMGPYHGVIYGGRIISMPHTYNAAGVCTSCGHER